MDYFNRPMRIYDHQHYTQDRWSCGLEYNYVPKKGYNTREDAERYMKRFSNLDKRLNVYQCAVCGKWHIGRSKSRMAL